MSNSKSTPEAWSPRWLNNAKSDSNPGAFTSITNNANYYSATDLGK